VTSEVAEAMEAVRKHAPATWGDWQSKDTLVRELAGTIVRVMDLAHHLDLPLGDALLAEIEANANRGFMHGGKKA
jgi:NTP pyrophosphatase (non-canonical NTP hydrolase)